MATSSTMFGALLLVALAAASVSSTFGAIKPSPAALGGEQFDFAKAESGQLVSSEEATGDHGDTRDDGNDDEFVLINVTEFVARVRGGIKQAKRIAKKYNLKLIRRVSRPTAGC